MAEMPPPQISIIGAGISGLVLGRCLLQRGIRSVVYEKDTAWSGLARYGYGITLQYSAYSPLLRILDLDDRTFRRRLAVDAAVGGTGKLHAGAQDGQEFRANRQRWEHLLREGLDIRWEHQLTGIQHDGSLNTLDFHNGSSIQADLVVDAEGPHSQIRKHMSPSTNFNVLPYAVYNGKRRLTLDTFKASYASHMSDVNVIEQRHGQTLIQISTSDRTEELVSISYTYSRSARQNDAIFDPDRPNSGAKDIPEALFDEVAQLANLEVPFKDVFNVEKMRQDPLLNWLMRSVSVNHDGLRDAASNGIVLMGDAVHATPILGGRGANAAIRDGMELAEFIAEHGTNDLVSFYDSNRHRRWSKEVEESERRLADMHGVADAKL